MIVHLQKLGIQANQTLRDQAGCLYTTALMNIECNWLKRPLAAGTRYQEEVKGKPGHGLGPPHLHVGMALLQGMLEELAQLAAKDQAEWKNDHDFIVETGQLLAPPQQQGFKAPMVSQLFASCRAMPILPNKRLKKVNQ